MKLYYGRFCAHIRQELGPLGLDVPPAGKCGFEELTAAYQVLLEPVRGPVHISGMTTMAECRAALLEDIIDAEDDPVGAVKIAIQSQDDVDVFAARQYAVREALCLWSDVPDLLEGALRV